VAATRIAAPILAGIAALAVGLLTGCAGSPAAHDRDAPDWVIEPPRGDAEYEYFVAAGSSPSGDPAEAEERASGSMIDEIVRMLGVRVTSTTTATARASLEQFETDVQQQIMQRAEARLAGFRVIDRFRHDRGTAVTVYLLGRYERGALDAERERLQALFQEREDAIAEPERQARRLELAGDPFAALGKYLEAAQAAASSELENAEIRAERNLNEARRLVSAMQLVKRNDNLAATVRDPFDEAFELEVVAGGAGVPGARVRVTYQEARADGRPGMRTRAATSDDNGRVRFMHPVPRTVGSGTVTMVLDLDPYLVPLRELEHAFQPQIDGLRRTAVRSQATFRYEVASAAHTVPTGIMVLDRDRAGNPVATGATGGTHAGILEALRRAEFAVRSLAIDELHLAGGDHSEALRVVREQYSGAVERLVLGEARIEEFTESDGVIVRVSGSITVLDVESGAVLHSSSAAQRSRANSAEGAVAAAFRSLGERFGEELASTLP